MRKLLHLAALVILFMLGGLSVADAHFLIFPIVSAVVANVFAAQVITFVITAALSVGLSYVASQLLNKGGGAVARTADSVGGVQLDIRTDPDTQRSILFGRCCTAGSLVYANTYGKLGNTENSNLIQIIALSDVPISDIVETWVEGKKRTVTGTTGERVVTDYNKVETGKPTVQHVKYLMYTGTQVSADPVASAQFGSPTGNRPWTSDMKGLGVAYVRTQEKYDKDLVPGMMQWKFVCNGIKLYDPRRDGAAGGTGTNAWRPDIAGTTASQYTFSQNAVLIAYNILRGIYFKGELVYGLGVSESQVPFGVWSAAMNDCATTAQDVTGGTYYWGSEITVDTEPLAVIREIIKACGGRFVEIGGIYKMYVGTTTIPHYSFTDEDVIDQDSSYKPFLPLEQRTNYITGRYTSPVNWLPKISPPRKDDERISEDGRRLPAELDCPGVHDQKQMQRLMKQMLLRSQRERRHVVTLPPPAFTLEPGDIVEWDSERNLYPTKLFDVESVEYHDNLCVTVSILELDPDDYFWDGIEDPLPEPDGPLPTQKPPPKIIEGFTVTAVTVTSANPAIGKKPAILVEWVDPQDDDFYAVDIQYRRFETTELFTDRGNDVPTQGVMIQAGLIPVTKYEVRGRYRTHSGKRSDWHAVRAVTTTNAKPGLGDSDPSVKQYVDDYSSSRAGEVQSDLDALNSLYNVFTGTTFPNATRLLHTRVTQGDGNVTLAYRAEIAAATDENSSIGTRLESLEANVGALAAGVQVRWVAGVVPGLAGAAYQLRVFAGRTYSGMTVTAVEQMVNGVLRKSSQVWFDVNYFMVGRSVGTLIPFKPMFTVEAGTVPKVVIRGDLIASGSIRATHLEVDTLEAITGKMGKLIAGSVELTKTNVGKLKITDNATVAGSGPELTIYRWVP